MRGTVCFPTLVGVTSLTKLQETIAKENTF
jgi:hypothetical protein